MQKFITIDEDCGAASSEYTREQLIALYEELCERGDDISSHGFDPSEAVDDGDWINVVRDHYAGSGLIVLSVYDAKNAAQFIIDELKGE